MKSYIQTAKAYLFLIFMSTLVSVGLSRAEQVYVKPCLLYTSDAADE